MSKNNENNPQIAVISLGSPSADDVMPAFKAFKKIKVIAVSLINDAAVAADDTNYCVVKLKNGSTVIGTIDTRASAQGALVALVGKDAVLSTTAGVEVAAGSSLSVDLDVGGTCPLTKAQLSVHYVGY